MLFPSFVKSGIVSRRSSVVALMVGSESVTISCRSSSSSLPSSSLYFDAIKKTTMKQQHLQQQQNRFIATRFHLPDHTNRYQPALTKIVATIGPTSEQEQPLYNVVQAGMDIMRLNFSHATTDEVELRCTNLKSAIKKQNRIIGILLDTKGPEIRTGKLQNDTSGHDTITLEQGSTITLRTDDATKSAGSTVTDLYIDYPYLSQAVKVGYQVLLDDGACILTVTQTDNVTYGSVQCTIQNTATLRSRAGVNLPLADTSDYLPALSDKDKADILYGMSNDVNIDYVAASFVQNGAGVRDIRSYIEECATKLGYSPNQPRPLIISKIETASALQHYDDILKESDAIMVARGDLGVEIPLQQVTNAQKEMIAACNAVGKPCIVATQMLESMTKNPRPTRAEVADVTNAVYDGTDAVMTSGETAKGKYPSETIKFMQSILVSAEEYLFDNTSDTHIHHPSTMEIPNTPTAVIAASTVTAANRTPDCQGILVLDAKAPGLTSTNTNPNSYSNLTALIAAYRPIQVPIIAVCTEDKIASQLTLYRGVRPLMIDANKSVVKVDDCMTILQLAKEQYQLEAGKPIVIVSSGSASDSSMKITVVP